MSTVEVRLDEAATIEAPEECCEGLDAAAEVARYLREGICLRLRIDDEGEA